MRSSGSAAKTAISIPDHEILCFIGSGSYGDVWLARNSLGRFRAVKVVHRTRFRDSKPFDRELQGIRRMEPISRSHAGVIAILHFGARETEGYFYYVMEAADDLDRAQNIDPGQYRPKMLSTLVADGSPLEYDACLELGISLTSALAHLHENGLVHRDVKSSNILFVNGRPKLADVGLVTGIGPGNSYVGTEGYIPPEGPGSERADIFSLGKVLYEAAFGSPVQFFPELPASLDANPRLKELLELNEVILKACHPDPMRRYARAMEMHRDLGMLFTGKSVKRIMDAEKRIAWMRKAAPIALAAVVFGGLILWQVHRNREMANEMHQVQSELQAQHVGPSGLPPQINSQPQDIEANVGCPIQFLVAAAGFGPLHFQWFFNERPIPQATNSTFSLAAVSAKDEGGYFVSVQNSVGSIRSEEARLRLNLTRIIPSAFDVWDVNEGVRLVKTSGFLAIGSPLGLFGQNGQLVMNEDAYTYFDDGAPDGFAHFVEWTIPNPTMISAVRLFAVGDGPEAGYAREFAEFILKVKSPGSENFDITLLTFSPSHPYRILDRSSWAILDVEIPPVIAQDFRAEFVQYNGHPGFDGPRIMEMDAFSTPPQLQPVILAQPMSRSVKKLGSVQFLVEASGGALHYAWSHNGTIIPGANNPTLTIDRVGRKDEGRYTVVVSNAAGPAMSDAAELKVLDGD